jgi:NADPH:quinone reductase-like Zn-dependent oxidoreductase
MKAFVVEKWLKGPEELTLKNVSLPAEPKKGELQIQVKAAGLNFFDTLMVRLQSNEQRSQKKKKKLTLMKKKDSR